MFKRRLMSIIALFSLFFQSTQGNYTREQLEGYLGKPVYSYVYITNLGSLDNWLYTTELSKILLVGSDPLGFTRGTVIGASVTSIHTLLFKNRFLDTRFESFIANVGKVSQQQLQEAIQDTILLSTASSQAYSVDTLLDYLIQDLQDKIAYIKNQIQYDFQYDQKSVHSMKKSLALSIGLIACVACINKYISCDNKGVKKLVFNDERLNAIAGLGMGYTLYKTLIDSYRVLTIHPHADNKYLDEFETLLVFVQNLRKELETNRAISFTLANGRIATLKVTDTFLGPVEGLSLDLDN